MEKYQVLREIGRGSFGKVTQIMRKSDHKILIWKELKFSDISEKEKSFITNEISILEELDHPNIVKQYEVIKPPSNNKIYIVMEYCEGGDLDKLILKNKSEKKFIDENLIWDIIIQTLKALKYLHVDKKVLHRDIKPSNIFLDKNYNIKLGDFGLSRKMFSFYVRTILGTPLYMSPEILDHRRYNEKSDIWSLGCSIYELATFKTPYEGSNVNEIKIKIKTQKPQRINEKYSDNLWNFILKMLRYDIENRFSAEELLREYDNNIPKLKDEKNIHIKWEELVLKEKNLDKKEKLILKRENSMKLKIKNNEEKEKELLDKELILKEKENKLKKKEKSLNLREQKLKEREQQLKEGEQKLKEEQEKLIKLRNEINQQMNILNNMKINNNNNNHNNIIMHNNNNIIIQNNKMNDLNNNNLNNNIQNIPIKNNFLNENDQNKKQIIIKNNNKKINIKQSKYTFLIQQNKLPKIGLKNLGKSSYVNSILQILRNIGVFANYFLNPEKISFLDNVKEIMPLSFAIKELYLNLYPKDKKNISIYEPLQILKVLYEINNNYTANRENNIIYVLNDILINLHRELNTSNIYEEKYNYDKHNRNDCINKGISFFTKINTSIIFNTLNWFSIRERRCIKCNTSIFHFETYNSYKLDILSCYNYNKLNNINKSISIIDCLKFHTSKFNESFFCEKCGKPESFESNFKIFSSPNIFIFLLDRGIDFNGNNELLNIPFFLEKAINLGDLIENKKAPFNYRLIGIASISLIDKKYVAWCKSPITDKWYFFNDEKIEVTKLTNIIELNNNNNYIPCILVYKDNEIS